MAFASSRRIAHDLPAVRLQGFSCVHLIREPLLDDLLSGVFVPQPFQRGFGVVHGASQCVCQVPGRRFVETQSIRKVGGGAHHCVVMLHVFEESQTHPKDRMGLT